MFLRRPGGQSQFAAPTWIRQAPPGPIQRAQELVDRRPGGRPPRARTRPPRRDERTTLRPVRSAGRSACRPPGSSPASGSTPPATPSSRRPTPSKSIARRCGFGTAETMRRTLVRHIGVSPDAYRRRFRHQPESRLAHDRDRHPPVPRLHRPRRHRALRGAPADPRLRHHVHRPRTRRRPLRQLDARHRDRRHVRGPPDGRTSSCSPAVSARGR